MVLQEAGAEENSHTTDSGGRCSSREHPGDLRVQELRQNQSLSMNTPHLGGACAHGRQGKPSKRLLSRPAREVELGGTGAPDCIQRLPWYGAAQPVRNHTRGEGEGGFVVDSFCFGVTRPPELGLGRRKYKCRLSQK